VTERGLRTWSPEETWQSLSLSGTGVDGLGTEKLAGPEAAISWNLPRTQVRSTCRNAMAGVSDLL